jgi:hypothetical protein
MKSGTPGSVEVGVYGAEAGEEYNNAPLDFKIFGFKGTPKYSKFDARSKGEITGGRKGKFPVITEAQKAGAVEELKANLQAKLFKKATDQIPSGFILFNDAAFVSIDSIDSIDDADFIASENNSFSLELKGVLYGLLFDEQKLSKKIAENNIKEYDGAVYIPNIRNLTFSISNKDNISFKEVKNINFNLKGTAKIVSRVNSDKLTADLLGKSKKDFSQILLQYPDIDSASLALSPIWKMSIPDKIKKIEVIVNYPEQ